MQPSAPLLIDDSGFSAVFVAFARLLSTSRENSCDRDNTDFAKTLAPVNCFLGPVLKREDCKENRENDVHHTTLKNML